MTKKDERTPEVLAAFEQGRAAARASIGRDDAPWGKGSDELKEWLRGYDSEKPVVDANPENQANDDANERPKAAGQTSTVSKAGKKA